MTHLTDKEPQVDHTSSAHQQIPPCPRSPAGPQPQHPWGAEAANKQVFDFTWLIKEGHFSSESTWWKQHKVFRTFQPGWWCMISLPRFLFLLFQIASSMDDGQRLLICLGMCSVLRIQTLHLYKLLNSYQPPRGKWLASENEWSQLRKQSLLTCSLKYLKFSFENCKKKRVELTVAFNFITHEIVSVVLYFKSQVIGETVYINPETCQNTSFIF